MLVKAQVVRGSSSDPDGMGRVTLCSEGLWVESLRVPVVGNVSLPDGVTVFVDISCGVDSPLVLGRSRDLSFTANVEVPEDGSLLWDSVGADGSWSAMYVRGGVLHIENSKGLVLRVSEGTVQVHDGSFGGILVASAVVEYLQGVSTYLSQLNSQLSLISGTAADAAIGTSIKALQSLVPSQPNEDSMVDGSFTH